MNENGNFGWFDLIILLIHMTPNIWGPRLVESPLFSDLVGLGSGVLAPVSPGLWVGLTTVSSRLMHGVTGWRAQTACHLVRGLERAGLAACCHGGSKSSTPPGCVPLLTPGFSSSG